MKARRLGEHVMKENKRKSLKRLIISVSVFASLFAIVAPLGMMSLEASEIRQVAQHIASDFETAKPTPEQLQSLALSEEEIDVYLNSGPSGITVDNGNVYDEVGNPIGDEVGLATFGRLSWAVRLVRIAIGKLPVKILSAFFGFTTIRKFLSLFEHMTGSIENAIYWTCIYVGMPEWLAWTIAKAVSWLI